MSVGDLWETTLVGLLQGETTMTVVHWLTTTAFTGPDPTRIMEGNTLANAVADLWNDHFNPDLSEDFTLVCALAQKILPIPRSPLATIFVNGMVGGVAVDSLAHQSAVVIQKFCDEPVAGPYRGRNYIPGVPQTYANAGVLIDGFAGNWFNNADNFFTTLSPPSGGAAYEPAVYSRKFADSAKVVLTSIPPSLGVIRGRRPRFQPFQTAEDPV